MVTYRRPRHAYKQEKQRFSSWLSRNRLDWCSAHSVASSGLPEVAHNATHTVGGIVVCLHLLVGLLTIRTKIEVMTLGLWAAILGHGDSGDSAKCRLVLCLVIGSVIDVFV